MVIEQAIKIQGPSGQWHILTIALIFEPGSLRVFAAYHSGTLSIPPGSTVANWISYYSPPSEYDSGGLDIGAGSRYVEIEQLRGIGLGSFLMHIIIGWALARPVVPVDPIYLTIEDAKTDETRRSRNRFWTKLGFELVFLDEAQCYGQSKEMLSSKLIQPRYGLAPDWSIEELPQDFLSPSEVVNNVGSL